MRTRILYNHWLPQFLKVSGVVAYPFILLSSSKREALESRLVFHELIHIRQIAYKGCVGFYGRFAWEYLRNFRNYKNHEKAVQAISYVRDAYLQQINIKLTVAEQESLKES